MNMVRAGASSKGQAGVEFHRPWGIEGQGWGLLGDRRKKEEKADWGALRRLPGSREVL